MSDVDTLDAVEGLLDADPEEFDSDAAYRDYVDAQLADLRSRLDDQEARDDAQEARTDAVLRQVEDLRETAERASERAERAELVASWGGLGYDDRLARVVSEVERRAATGAPRTLSGPEGKTTVRRATIATTEVEDRPGVYELFDGAVSRRTCRTYVDDLSECAGLSVEDADRGGFGGGATPKRLRLDLSTFRAAYGEEWSVDDLLDDMEGEL